MTSVTIYANGLVVKEWSNGKTWSEYPVVYVEGKHIGYDKPELFSQREKAFIRKYLAGYNPGCERCVKWCKELLHHNLGCPIGDVVCSNCLIKEAHVYEWLKLKAK